MANEVMIPPWVRPESPETIRIIDDATVAFQPAFGRGMTQRGIFADPRWGLRRRYRGLRSDEKAAILNALNESRGQLNTIRVTPHTPMRGSFATSELLTNNTFASGTTGWSSNATYSSIAVSDRILRNTRSRSVAGSGGPFILQPSTLNVTQYAPYVIRYFTRQGRGDYSTDGVGIFDAVASENLGSTTSYGMFARATVPRNATLSPGLYDGQNNVAGAGDYILIPYASVTRGALVDIAPNALLRSDAFNTAPWSSSQLASITTGQTDPFGTSTAQLLVENAATADHYVTQSVTCSSAVADYSICVLVKPSNRNFVRIQVQETSGSTYLDQFFNLSTGAVGTTGATGANWSNRRAFVVPFGDGWYYCCLVGRKTSAATGLNVFIISASADGTSSYTGTNGIGAVYLWRATLAQSSVPTRPSQTTSAATSGNSPTGSAMYTKGWPASTSGLLLTGDWFEINGEMKQLTAKVDSDAAGLAYMQFRPGLAGAPADNDPIVVYEPFGRFIYPAGVRELENQFGLYADCEMNLEEVYS